MRPPCLKHRYKLRWLLLVLGLAVAARAEPGPGDVFREYIWSAGEKWQRITSPDAVHARAKKFLPNPVNLIEVTDLEGATRVEVQLELLQSHFGTTGQALRINGGAWHPISRPVDIPGNSGRGDASAEMWLTMLYPTVDLPLASLRTGGNTFEFTCRPGKGLAERWPQSLVYAAIFRVYYGPDKLAPTGRVFAPVGRPGRFGTIELMAEPLAAPGRSIRKIDFLARYRGYDWRGNGVQHSWHYQTHFGALRRHSGSAFAAPWKTEWDVRIVPAQDEPVQIAARIEDDHGLCRMTEAITLPEFRGLPNVHLFVAHDVPPHWQSRAGRRHSCKIALPEDLSHLAEAKLILATWNGDQSEELGINETVIMRNIGYNHDLSYDEITIPVKALRPGENEFYTSSRTEEHGVEVLWPGAVLLARFAPGGSAH
jgi:hypothetical protein